SLSFDSWNFLEASSFKTTCDNPFFRSRKHALLALPCPRKSRTSCIPETSTGHSHKTQNKIMYPPSHSKYSPVPPEDDQTRVDRLGRFRRLRRFVRISGTIPFA